MHRSLRWTAKRARHVTTRSERYAGATDLELAWVDEAADDPFALVADPDPKSQVDAVRIVGFSPSAGFVITVIARRIDGDLWCDSAWKTTGAERRMYWEGRHGST